MNNELFTTILKRGCSVFEDSDVQKLVGLETYCLLLAHSDKSDNEVRQILEQLMAPNDEKHR